MENIDGFLAILCISMRRRGRLSLCVINEPKKSSLSWG